MGLMSMSLAVPPLFDKIVTLRIDNIENFVDFLLNGWETSGQMSWGENILTVEIIMENSATICSTIRKSRI